MWEYGSHEQCTKIRKISEIDFRLSPLQIRMFNQIFITIGELKTELNTINLKIKSSLFLNSLLNKEAISSNRIEGSQTRNDETFFDIKGIDNIFAWSTRNLINSYKETFIQLENRTFSLSIERLTMLHEKMFTKSLKSKWKQTFDPSQILNHVRPGTIIVNDETPNWFGTGGIDTAKLIFVQPSKKIEYLKNLFSVLNKKEEYTLEWLILFHPIFEAIHPFADGNGRLGRMLFTTLFKYYGITEDNWILISDLIEQNRTTYMDELNHVQLTNDWSRWANFFIKLLTKSVQKKQVQIRKIIKLYNQFSPNLSSTSLLILKTFFKFPIIYKARTIEWLKHTHNIPQTNAYRDFKKVANLLKANEVTRGMFRFNELIEIINQI